MNTNKPETSIAEVSSDASVSAVAVETAEAAVFEAVKEVGTVIEGAEPKTEEAPKISKNQLKRLRKEQKWEANKEARTELRKQKRQEKKVRIRETKLKALEEATSEPAEGIEVKRRKPFVQVQSGIKAVVDLDFVTYMLPKELQSVVTQVGRCYTANRTAERNIDITFTSFSDTWKGEMHRKFPDHGNWKTVP
jgi:tRNA (guanine9-N1)-methyltransferase